MTDYINMTWVYWVLMTAYAVTILGTIAIVLSENRNPVKSLAWVTVLLTLPALGLVLYFLFGRSFKKKRYISRRNQRKLKKHKSAKAFKISSSELSEESNHMILLGQSVSGAPFYQNNSAKYFTSGAEKFEAFLHDISRATKFIYIEYYIIASDETGNRLADALIERAHAGVEIKVMYDHVGSFKTKNRFFRRMRDEGIEVYPFLKVRFPLLGTRINWRNHRKITVIDGEIGYIGGMNIANRYIDGGSHGNWHDGHLRVKGPIIHSLLHSFAADWNFMGRPLPNGISIAKPDDQPENWGMQLVTSGPIGRWPGIAMEFQEAIGGAKKNVWLQTPYFLPNESLLKALQTAALAKVDVRVMIPLKSDSDLLRYASFSYIKECLQAGIKIYLYREGMLHTKMLLVDDEMVTVGSTNFDFRSFEHNFESNLFIYSKEFNESMRKQFVNDIKSCERVLPYHWAKRSTKSKVLESVTRIFAPIL